MVTKSVSNKRNGGWFRREPKEEFPSIHSSLSPDEKRKLSDSFVRHNINDPKLLSKPPFLKRVKAALKASGIFKDVSAVPGAKGDFKVVFKGSSGKVAQGSVEFAVPTSV